MLSVASVHHPETPGSASKRSALGHYSDRSSLKRRKSQPESCITHKKSLIISSNESPYSEITLQVLHQKNATPTTLNNPSDINALLQSTIISASVPVEDSSKESLEQRLRKVCQQSPKSDKPIVISVSSDSGQDSLNTVQTSTPNRKVVTTDEIFSSNGFFQLAKQEEKTVTPTKSSRLDASQGSDSDNEIIPASPVHENPRKSAKLSLNARLLKATEGLKNVGGNKSPGFLDRKASEKVKRDLQYDNRKSTEVMSIITPTPQELRSLDLVRKCSKKLEVDEEPKTFGRDAQYYEEPTDNEPIPSTFFQPSCSQSEPEADWNMPYYYTMGFPNPPGENRCWLNATLHALFALPFIKHLDSVTLPQASKLLEALVKLQTFWRKGNSEKSRINQCLKFFKQELVVLDDSYPSERQQDVSEFLMIFLNYIKTYFDKVAKNLSNEEIENVPKNQQDTSRRGQLLLDSSKRQPLADISSAAGQSRMSQKFMDKSQMKLTMPLSDSSSDESEAIYNPIDEFFLLHMVENYVCDGCSKKRSKKVDNMMLYIDLPGDNDVSTIDLAEAIKKTFDVEHRNLTCESCRHDVHSIDTKFRKPPKILMVQINRYGITSSGEMNKICTAVEIPKVLKVDSSMISEDASGTEYEPICIISHVGSAMDCGHYTSYVKYEEEWYYYNDMHVLPMTGQEALESTQTTAYVVFFKDRKLTDNC